MSALPGLVRRLLDEKAWCEFTAPGLPKPVTHERFSSFVAAEPPRGLGGKAAQLVALCGADGELRTRVERLLRSEIEAAPERGEVGRGRVRKRTTLPNSETADRHLARLKRADPELAAKVVNGEMSAYAAAREKGWKPPRIQVTTPERTAAHLRKYMKPNQLIELARLLLTEET